MHRVFNPLLLMLNSFVMLVLLGGFQAVSAQNSVRTQNTDFKHDSATEPSRTVPQPDGKPAEQGKTALSSAPVIGSGDEVEITVYGAPDLSKRTRVSSDGNISIPLIGNVRVAGLTSNEAEGAIEAQLRQNNVLLDPQVSVYVKEYTSSGISVFGEVAHPGVYSPLGPHRLLDILQAAGGLTEKAANEASIAHRGGENPITVKVSKNPGEMARDNVELFAGDTVVVPKAGIVYVLGEVYKPGGYVLNSNGGTTVLRVVAAAGGPTRAAALGGTKMIRRTPRGLQELSVPLKSLLHAKVADIPVEPDDILYVPSSHLKTALNAGALLTTLGTTAIYRVPF